MNAAAQNTEISDEPLADPVHIRAFLSDLLDQAAHILDSTEDLRMNAKVDGSPVTKVDIAIEEKWRKEISKRFPDHSIVGEEYGTKPGGESYTWYIDPIDGTDDLVRGMPLFASLIGLKYEDQPIAGAIAHHALGLRILGFRGDGVRTETAILDFSQYSPRPTSAISMPSTASLRVDPAFMVAHEAVCRDIPNTRIYRNAFGHSMVLTGAIDAAVEFNLAPWDIVATEALVREAGGKFVSLDVSSGDESRALSIFGQAPVVDRLSSSYLSGIGKSA